MFIKRSISRPLDISINLESYREWHGTACHEPVPLDTVLAILGPHIGRWRTLAFRGWSYQIQEFFYFAERAPVPPLQLEYTHLSSIEEGHDRLPPAWEFLGSGSFLSLRVGMGLELNGLTAFKAVQCLDVECQWDIPYSEGFRYLFGPCSTLTTVIIRNFPLDHMPHFNPIDCSTIRSFAVSFSYPFFYNVPFYHRIGGFETLANTFALPNIEYLEILGGFAGGHIEHCLTQLPEVWEAPLFPHLQTLRLEDVGFSHAGLSLIQSFSSNITTLQLINTTRNDCLLVQSGGWPALRTLTVEARVVSTWIASFVDMRSAEGRPIVDLTLPFCDDGFALAYNPTSAIHFHRTAPYGPSPALMDGVYGPGFYIDEYDMRPTDFAHVKYPTVRKCRCCETDWSGYLEWRLEEDMKRLEEEIERDFKIEGEVVRSKGTLREAKRQRRRECGALLTNQVKHSPRSRCRSVAEDFSVV
jgi:hypothetical protein